MGFWFLLMQGRFRDSTSMRTIWSYKHGLVIVLLGYLIPYIHYESITHFKSRFWHNPFKVYLLPHMQYDSMFGIIPSRFTYFHTCNIILCFCITLSRFTYFHTCISITWIFTLRWLIGYGLIGYYLLWFPPLPMVLPPPMTPPSSQSAKVRLRF